MPKKIENTPKKPIIVTEQAITDTIEQNFMPYAMSVIVSRAIPQIDGFKPAHRKLLYTMYKMGLLTGGRVKSADIVGQTMRLNPHGEGAIYETLVRLTRGNGALLHPFVDSKGNFGKVYSRDMAYAASRYTEAKLDAFCAEVFKDIDKDNVEFSDNYNGTMKEPLLLPTTFPNVLVTPNMGIAVGMASSIAPFNLIEICNAAIAYLKDENCDFTKIVLAPDFPTGGELIYDAAAIKQIYETGRGSVKLRAKFTFDKKNSCIEITEIPYSTTIEAIIDKIIALIKANKIKDITDVRDETGLAGLKIAIDIRRSANPDVIMHKLFQLTPLSDSFSCNFNILVNGRPKTMGIREILDEWLTFRIDCVSRRVRFDLNKHREQLHLLAGLSKILLDIDKAIAIIRGTEEDKLVIPNLMKGFDIDEKQAEYIAEIKLRNLNKAYLLNKTNEMDALRRAIEELEQLLNDGNKMNALIAKELREVAKKYGTERKTSIVHEHEIEVPEEAELVADYAVRLFLTEHNYFKKLAVTSLRFANEQTLKPDDRLIATIDTTNRAEILFFTDKMNVYKMKASEFADQKPSAYGDYLPNVLGLSDERILYMAATTDYSGFVIFAYENGKVSKIVLSAYQTKMNRKKLVNAYSDKSPLVFMGYYPTETDLVIYRGTDKALLINTELVPAMTQKNAQGVQVLTLKRNSSLTRVVSAAESDLTELERYRSAKIPSSGHFLPSGQLGL